MKAFQLVISLIILHTASCQNIQEYFNKINSDITVYNSIAAQLAWNYSMQPDDSTLPLKSANFQRKRLVWLQNACFKLGDWADRQLLNETELRQTYLLCRGPRFTFEESRTTSSLYKELQSIYSDAEICLPSKTVSTNDVNTIEAIITTFLNSIKQETNHYDSILLAVRMSNTDAVDKEKSFCIKGEDMFGKLMRSRNEEVLKWVWLVWREKVGPAMRKPYRDLVVLENEAARRNGYNDIGQSWRDDLEMPELRQICRQLFREVKPLYVLLHGVTRFFLRRHYGDVVPEKGPIPAHLLGSLWSQDWATLADLIIPRAIDLDESIKQLNWTVDHMVKRGEDFYQSLGLPPMTDTFWRESVFSQNGGSVRCHGSAADMYKEKDYRLLYCSGTSFEDLYVIHHEMGHIQYYMAYEKQPVIFRQANSAFHETIGDTIMLGVVTPQHLHRLGLINDTLLYVNQDKIRPRDYSKHKRYELKRDEYEKDIHFGTNDILDASDGNYEFKNNIVNENLRARYKNTKDDIASSKMHETTDDYQYNKSDERKDDETIELVNAIKESSLTKATTDEILMLKQALNKIPQIPFALLIDEYRWKYFEGAIEEGKLNEEFWRMASELQGIGPPSERGEQYFDVGAKFHVPDNTPYIRYFLASFLQYQLYESLCKAAVFGKSHATQDVPPSITMNRCDIYGSKAVGKLLKDFMSRGHSQSWRQILQSTIRSDHISAKPLNRYYRPLYKVLNQMVREFEIPLGW